MPAILPVTDEEAANAFDEYPTASPGRQQAIAATLLQFDAQRDQQAQQEADTHFEKLYTDPGYFDSVSKSSEVQLAAKANPFPDAVKYRGANQAYLAHSLGVDPDTLKDTYEAHRDGYAQANFGKATMTDEAFFNAVAGQQKEKIARRDAVNEIPGDIVVSALSDLDSEGGMRPVPALLSAWKDRNADLLKNASPGEEAAMIQAAQAQFEETTAFAQKYAPQVKSIFSSLKKFTAGTGKGSDSEQLGTLADSLAAMPPEDRQKLYGMVALYAQRSSATPTEAGDIARVWAKQFGESLSRTVTETVAAANLNDYQQSLSNKIALLDSGDARVTTDEKGTPTLTDVLLPGLGGLPPVSRDVTPEERTALVQQAHADLEKIKVVRELRGVATGDIDPAKALGDGWMEHLRQGSYVLGGSLPYVGAMVAGPEVGIPLTMAAISSSETNRVLAENPDLPIGQAQIIGAVSGGAQTAAMMLTANVAKGLPTFGALLKGLEKASPTTAQTLVKLGAKGALSAAEIGAQTEATLATPMLVDGVAQAMGADMPGNDFGKKLQAFKDANADPATFLGMLPFWLVGMGVASIHDVKTLNAVKDNAAGLSERMGISQEDAAKIAAESDPDKKDALIQKAWEAIPEETKVAKIKEMNARADATRAQNEDAATPTVRAVKMEDGSNGFSVEDAQGNEIYRTTDEDAAHAALTSALSSHEAGQQDVTAKLVNYFRSVNDRRGLEDVTFTEGEKPKTGQEFIDSLPDEDKPAAIDQLRERLRIEAMRDSSLDPNGSLSSFVIDGQSEAEFRDGIFHAVNKIARGTDPLVVVQEHVETETKRALGEGRVTMDWLREQVAAYEQSSGEKLLTDSDQSVIEGVSTLAQSYVAGKLKDPAFPPGLRGYFKQLIQYFRHVFVRAAKLKKAIRDGKVGKDFETFLAQSIGLDDEAQIAKVRDAELGRSFSINPNEQPSPGGRVAEEIPKPSHIGQISDIVQTLDLARPRNEENIKYLKGEYARHLRSKGIESIDAYHVSGATPNELKTGINGSAVDYIGGSGNLRESSVYLFLDPDDIKRGFSGVLGTPGDSATVAHIKIPLSKLPDLFWDSNFNVSFDTYSAVRISGDVPKKWIEGFYKYDQSGDNVKPNSRAPKGGETFSIKPAEYSAKLDEALAKLETDPELRKDRVQAGRKALAKIRDRVKTDETSREGLIRGMGELEAIIRILPTDARGKIGGYRKLSTYKTDRGRINFLTDRIEKVEYAFEDWLKDHYNDKLEKLFKRAEPAKDEAGKKKVGKAGAETHRLFDTLRAAVDWTPEQAEAHATALEASIATGELTPEQEAHATIEAALVPMVADWKSADAARREAAVKNATDVFDAGYSKFVTKKLAERERRTEIREKLQADTGKVGTAPERDAKTQADNGLKGDWKNSLLGLLNFEQVTHWVFGHHSKDAQRLADMERESSNVKQDAIFEKMNNLDAFFAKLAGDPYKAQKLRWELAQKTLEIKTGERNEARKLSPFEAITATLMWRQADGKRHMLGKVDDNGKPAGKWRYDQSFIDEIESKLSPEAKSVREYLAKEYAGEYATLNPIYRELNGIDLPQNPDYSPLTVTPLQAQGGMTVDPVTGSTMSGASFTPGSLRSRGSSIAEPDFRDAVQTYIAHTKQMEHWKAYARFSHEARAILSNRDLGNSVEAKSGKEAVRVLRGWLDLFAQGGTRDAAAHLAMNQMLSRMSDRAASVAIVGRIGTLAIQSTQLAASLAEMPTGAYLHSLGKLFTGQLGWSAAFKSDYIQRRLKEMPPIVRQAVEGLRSEKTNVLRHTVAKMGRLIGGTDALFTAGTFAMVHDYQLSQAKKQGLSGAEAEAFAMQAAERATDRIAQPTRPGARSLFENTATNPLVRVVWAFASESRKNLGLVAYALAKRTPAERLRTVAYVGILSGMISTLIRSAWQDIRDDSDDEVFDEKHWGFKRFLLGTVSDPLNGIPVLGGMAQNALYKSSGQYLPERDLFSGAERAIPAIKRAPELVTGQLDADQSFHDVDAILSGIGLLNGDVAAAASLSHLARDLFGSAKNTKKAATGDE